MQQTKKTFLKSIKYSEPKRVDFDQARKILSMVWKIVLQVGSKIRNTRCSFTKMEKRVDGINE